MACRGDNFFEGGIMVKNVLIPTDGSKLSVKAIKSGVAFAKSVKARVTAQ